MTKLLIYKNKYSLHADFQIIRSIISVFILDYAKMLHSLIKEFHSKIFSFFLLKSILKTPQANQNPNLNKC